jgi:hypothetical protein
MSNARITRKRNPTPIGTEYVRETYLAAADAKKVRALLESYTDQRILVYKTVDEQELRRLDASNCSTTNGTVDDGRKASSTQQTPVSTDHFGHERCVEFPGVHAGSMVQSYFTYSMGPYVDDRFVLQSADRRLHSPH